MRSSSIHGCNHAADKDYHLAEKCDLDNTRFRIILDRFVLQLLLAVDGRCSNLLLLFNNFWNLQKLPECADHHGI
jgi:hypothetical protein